MEMYGFVLGILAVAAVAVVVGVVMLILQVRSLWGSVRDLTYDPERMGEMIQNGSDVLYVEIGRVEAEKSRELNDMRDESKRDMLRLEALLDSRLDKLYERIVREMKEASK